MKKIFFLAFLIIVSQAGYSQQAEDYVYLKDGLIVKGVILRIDKIEVVLQPSNDSLRHFKTADVQKIAKSNTLFIKPVKYNQTAKGSFQIGGGFSYSHLKYTEFYTEFIKKGHRTYEVLRGLNHNYEWVQFSSSVIYFPFDNFGAGLTFTMNGLDSETEGVKYNYGAGLNLQYYFGSGIARPFLSAGALYLLQKGEDGDMFNFGGGLSIKVNEGIAIQPLVQYGGFKYAGQESEEFISYNIVLSYFLF